MSAPDTRWVELGALAPSIGLFLGSVTITLVPVLWRERAEGTPREIVAP